MTVPRARIIAYNDYSKDHPLLCPVCGWQGSPQDGGIVEFHDDLLDVSCPCCDKMILIVSYPETYLRKGADRWRH